ncbi:MAG: tetratricopeptide repeat protein [Actinobacteria bacterium]|nr:tetratricopeptide repeat protein [Actinomycetota bacterium]
MPLLVAVLSGSALLASCGGGPVAQGRELESKGDLAGAVSLYEQALKEHPNDVEILAALGSDLYILGKFNEALPIQEKTVALDPNDVQTRVELGFNYLNHQNRPADAVRVLTEAVSREPSAKNLSFLAEAQESNQDASGAEASLRKAIQTDPKYAFSYQLLVKLLTKLGRTQDAAQVERMASQQGINPNSSQ